MWPRLARSTRIDLENKKKKASKKSNQHSVLNRNQNEKLPQESRPRFERILGRAFVVFGGFLIH